MVESTENVLPLFQAESGTHAASELSSLLESVGLRSEERLQLSKQREAFKLLGIYLDDEETLAFYQSTKTLETDQVSHVLQNVGARILRFRSLGCAEFSYSDWRSVQDLERSFLEFGLAFDEGELFELYDADSTQVFGAFRAKVHANLRKMLELISEDGEQLPGWLEQVLDGESGAEAVLLIESDERETYKNLLNTMFDSHGLTNRRYLIEQVLDSFNYSSIQ